MAYFQNRCFSKSPILKQNFVKISWIGPWISRIDWCKGHWCGLTYMVVRLSSISPQPILSIDPWTSCSRVRSKRVNSRTATWLIWKQNWTFLEFHGVNVICEISGSSMVHRCQMNKLFLQHKQTRGWVLFDSGNAQYVDLTFMWH